MWRELFGQPQIGKSLATYRNQIVVGIGSISNERERAGGTMDCWRTSVENAVRARVKAIHSDGDSGREEIC